MIAFPFSGDQTELLNELVDALDDEDLKRIACLDRGDDFDDHLAKLRRIKAAGLQGFILDGYLVEVLDLCSWSEPLSGQDVTRFHRQRAFCCGLIYGSGETPSERFYTDEAKLIQFAESLIALGHSRAQIIRFFSWLLSDTNQDDSEGVFIGVLTLMFALQEKECGNVGILALIDWIICTGDAADLNETGRRCARGWDFGIDGRGRFNAKWRVLLESVPDSVQARHGSVIKEGVTLIVSMTLPAVTDRVW